MWWKIRETEKWVWMEREFGERLCLWTLIWLRVKVGDLVEEKPWPQWFCNKDIISFSFEREREREQICVVVVVVVMLCV